MSLLEKLENKGVSKAIEGEEDIIVDKHADLKERVNDAVLETYDEIYIDNEIKGKTEQEYVLGLIKDKLKQEDVSLTTSEEKRVIQEIYDDIMGFGPIEPLIRDKSVSEIMVNNIRDVYVERNGKLELTNVKFRNDEQIVKVINRIVSPIGRRCDESSPMVDARLPDGSRVNAVIPPVALKGPNITIRKFSDVPLKMSDLISYGSLSYYMADFLEACVKGKCNVIVSGGTGSGKTTLLNVLSSFIPDNERIVTIEDAAELRLNQRHVITMESRPANTEGVGEINIRDLVKNSLRMRPDRIVVGEVRGGEALDMLQAMNTGHEGSLTTAHANHQRDLLGRLETMVMMSGMKLPSKAIREQIVSAIDIVVQQTRLRDGTRKIVAISEVTGMEGDVITMQDIFLFNYDENGKTSEGKVLGKFEATGVKPFAAKKIRENGGRVRDEWFKSQND